MTDQEQRLSVLNEIEKWAKSGRSLYEYQQRSGNEMNSMARKVSRNMITVTKVADIAEKSLPQSISVGETTTFGITCYESGMIDVLRGVAAEDMEYGMGSIAMTPRMKEWLAIGEEKAENLRQNLDEDTNSLFNEFEEAFQNSSMAEVEENFIQGFIRGYRYLKNQIEYRGGSL